MSWLTLSILGYFFNAIAFIGDKALLGHVIKNPYIYTIAIGVLGTAAIVFVPFGFIVPSASWALVIMLSGALLIGALIAFFHALKVLETSRVVPFIGGLVPMSTFVLSFLFLGERFSLHELIAFVLLIAGGIVITLGGEPRGVKALKRARSGWMFALLAALLFSSSFVLTKYLYSVQAFLTVFIVARFGSLVAVLFLLFDASLREEMKRLAAIFRTRAGALFLTSQAMGAAGFLLINVAIARASVTLVNALQGVQYVFLLVLVVLMSLKYPKLLKEQLTPAVIGGKVAGVVLITVGLWALQQPLL